MTPVRLEPTALRSKVKHSTTESLHSQQVWKKGRSVLILTRPAVKTGLTGHYRPIEEVDWVD